MKYKMTKLGMGAVGALLIGATAAQSAVWTWTNGGGDNVFTNAANWDNGFPSNETMVVSMDGVNKAILASGETLNMDGIRVSYVSGDSGEFEQTGGVLNMTALSSRESVIGHGGGTGLWTMTGGEAYFNNMAIGAGGGTGTMIMEGGVMNFANAYKGGSIIIGTETATSVGTFELAGGLVKTASGIKLGSDTEGTSIFHVNGGSGVVSNGIANMTSPGFWYQDGGSTLKATIDSDDGFSLGQIILYGVSNSAPYATFQYGATLELGFSGDDMGEVTNSWDLITFPEGTVITDNGLALTNTNTDVWSFDLTNNALRVTYGIADSSVAPTNPPPSSPRTLYWTGNGDDMNATNAANWDVDLAGTAATWGVYADDTLYVGDYRLNLGDVVSECTIDGLLFPNQNALHIGRQSTAIVNFNSGSMVTPKKTYPDYIGWEASGDGTLNVNGGSLSIYSTELGNAAGAQGTINLTGGELLVPGRIASTGGNTERASIWIGSAGGTGTMTVSGGLLKTLIGVVLGDTAGVGTFCVEGAGASEISIGGTRSDFDGYWVQESGSTLKVRMDDSDTGVTAINILEGGNDNGASRVGLADVVFEAGSILDIGWMDGVSNYGSFDVMTFGGSVTNKGLVLADGIDTDIWSYAFVDTDGDSSNDTLRVTASAGFTDNGTPINWLYDYGLDVEDDELDNDSDGLLTWKEYVAGTVPTNAASVFAINSMEHIGDEYVISWWSIEGKSYSVITNLDLLYGTPGVVVSGIAGLPSETSVTSSVPTASGVYYSIGVE